MNRAEKLAFSKVDSRTVASAAQSLLPVVVVVAEDPLDRRIISEILRREPVQVIQWPSLRVSPQEKSFREADVIILCDGSQPAAALQLLADLRAQPENRLVPICVILATPDEAESVKWMDAGADEVFIKPFHPSVLLARVRSLLRHKFLVDRLEEAETALFVLARAIEYRDPAVAGHCERLAYYSLSLGRELGLSDRELKALYRGSYLHDIGKVAIPDSVLHKQGPLTPEEWQLMKQHTVLGEQICKTLKSLKEVLPIIRSHHERWDGSGYPDGLKGEEIPLLARVLQVADIFDALTTARSYKPAMPVDKALRVLEEEAAWGWRDPAIVETFVQAVRQGRIIPQGTMDELSEQIASLLRELDLQGVK